MMNISFSLTGIKKKFTAFLRRFHVMVFVIIVLNGLTIVVFLLNNIVIRSGESGGYTSSSNNTEFDQATIKRIEELKTHTQADDTLDLSKGRINPFVE